MTAPSASRACAYLALFFVAGGLASSISAAAQQPNSQGQQVQPPPAVQTQPVQIDRNGVLILVRSTLLALDHANQTGNYTVLRDLGAPGFQAANTAARLSEIFANLRAQNLDLSGIAVLEPQLTTLPQTDARGYMHMGGFFPSVPLQVNFELLFAPVDGKWKLFGISLNLGQPSPSAPRPPEAPKDSGKAPDAVTRQPRPAAPAAKPPARSSPPP